MAESETLRSITKSGLQNISNEIKSLKGGIDLKRIEDFFDKKFQGLQTNWNETMAKTAEHIIHSFTLYDTLQELSPSLFKHIFHCMRALNHIEDQVLAIHARDTHIAWVESMYDRQDGTWQEYLKVVHADEQLLRLHDQLFATKQPAEAFAILMQLRLAIMRYCTVHASGPQTS
jgi:hypothetical protein